MWTEVVLLVRKSKLVCRMNDAAIAFSANRHNKGWIQHTWKCARRKCSIKRIILYLSIKERLSRFWCARVCGIPIVGNQDIRSYCNLQRPPFSSCPFRKRPPPEFVLFIHKQMKRGGGIAGWASSSWSSPGVPISSRKEGGFPSSQDVVGVWSPHPLTLFFFLAVQQQHNSMGKKGTRK